MDRKERLAFLVDHFGNPRHKGVLEGADVRMPGGSPECGGSVVVYLKGDRNGGIEGLSWTGQGDTISMGATSAIVERVRDEGLTLQEVLDLDYEGFVDSLGRDVIGSRTRNATLGLSTIKSAVRRYLKGHPKGAADRPPGAPASPARSPVFRVTAGSPTGSPTGGRPVR